MFLLINKAFNVTDEIKSQLRSNDYFERIGGEEFAILMQNTELDDSLLLAERIRISVAKRHITVEDKTHSITVSIGVAEYITHEEMIFS